MTKEEISRIVKTIQNKEYRMYENYKSRYKVDWKNIPILRELYALVMSFPDNFPSYSMGRQEDYLVNLVIQAPWYDCPRLCLEIEEKIRGFYKKRKDQDKLKYAWKNSDYRYKRLKDYLNLNLSLETFMKRHEIKFEINPLARTPEWEEHIYEASREAAGSIQAPEVLGDSYNETFRLRLTQVLKTKGIGVTKVSEKFVEEEISNTLKLIKQVKELAREKRLSTLPGARIRLLRALGDLVDSYYRHEFHIQRVMMEVCTDWEEMKIMDQRKFRKEVQLGIDVYNSLSPDSVYDWAAFEELSRSNHPAVFVDDLEEFYDILKKAIAKSRHEDVIRTASSILKRIWDE